MNSSPSLSRAPSSAGTAGVVSSSSPFPYYSVAPAAGASLAELNDLTEGAAQFSNSDTDVQRANRAGSEHATGFEEGRLEARKTFDEQLARERSGVADALSHFSPDRATYFEKVEGEVVQLALSIAGKIMHREAQLDPMLLAAIVRVALEKIERGTGVVLR